MFNDRGHSILLYRSTREYDVYRKIIIEEYLMTQGNVQEILRNTVARYVHDKNLFCVEKSITVQKRRILYEHKAKSNYS